MSEHTPGQRGKADKLVGRQGVIAEPQRQIAPVCENETGKNDPFVSARMIVLVVLHFAASLQDMDFLCLKPVPIFQTTQSSNPKTGRRLGFGKQPLLTTCMCWACSIQNHYTQMQDQDRKPEQHSKGARSWAGSDELGH